MENKNLTLGSLFDGSGGFPLGGLVSGITPVWASEIEPFCIRVTTRRLLQMKHYGDVSEMDGGEVEPVDIITFGSPCQDMSVAGRRKGLDGARSGLFYQAVRVIKEMREKTNGGYPKFVVWENVPGAFSSNRGEDFKAVLEALCGICEGEVHIPEPPNGRWRNAGEIVGDGYSVAWRVLDAQYWGVPQRRRRIYLVLDLAGGRAGKILFESEGLPRGTPQGTGKAEGTARTAEEGTGAAGDDGVGLMFENHPQDARCRGPLETAPTVAARYGTGGNSQPFVIEKPVCYGICSKASGAMLSDNPKSGFYEAQTSRCLDTHGSSPLCNQGGMAVVAVQGSVIGRDDRNGPNGSGVNEDVSFTLNTVDRHAVAYGIGRAAFNQGMNTNYGFAVNEETQPTMLSEGPGAVAAPAYCVKTGPRVDAVEECSPTLMARDYKDPIAVNRPEYIVRRLTPLECARLQGFPDWWTDDLGTDDPAEDDIAFWTEVFETHRKVTDPSKKPKTRKQIIKWLRDPFTDAAAYKMWGNGVALPCVVYVLSGIVYHAQFSC